MIDGNIIIKYYIDENKWMNEWNRKKKKVLNY